MIYLYIIISFSLGYLISDIINTEQKKNLEYKINKLKNKNKLLHSSLKHNNKYLKYNLKVKNKEIEEIAHNVYMNLKFTLDKCNRKF